MDSGFNLRRPPLWLTLLLSGRRGPREGPDGAPRLWTDDGPEEGPGPFRLSGTGQGGLADRGRALGRLICERRRVLAPQPHQDEDSLLFAVERRAVAAEEADARLSYG